MFRLRCVCENDLEDLFTLSKFYTFINLPSDKDVIKKLIASSYKSFSKPNVKMEKNHYFFVLEDLTKHQVIGCSIIHAQHGTSMEPHFFLKVNREHKYSKSINTGFIHGTLKLGHETNGPSEIGGLILHPDYRKNHSRLGKQLSFVRFLYIALNPSLFKDEIHSELLPPFDKDGKSPLWEAIGRRFLNMEYQEADLLSRDNKEFILSLFPKEIIYETLLPMEARQAIGKVGHDTKPVKAMLEKIGFTYIDEVDPFDGGPHYRCKTQEILPISSFKQLPVSTLDDFDNSKAHDFLVLSKSEDHIFSCIMIKAICETNKFYISSKSLTKLNIKEDDIISSIPL